MVFEIFQEFSCKRTTIRVELLTQSLLMPIYRRNHTEFVDIRMGSLSAKRGVVVQISIVGFNVNDFSFTRHIQKNSKVVTFILATFLFLYESVSVTYLLRGRTWWKQQSEMSETRNHLHTSSRWHSTRTCTLTLTTFPLTQRALACFNCHCGATFKRQTASLVQATHKFFTQ